MAPSLPSSLSPHICIVSSPDLTELLTASSLPPLSDVFQSFSPLPQVNTRTTSLASVPHKSFSLRFSDLSEVEAASREDEEQRAVRTIDWIGARISTRCAQWVEDIENLGDKQPARMPWWEELKRCVEGDNVPSKTETWNHPAAVILAVSTNTSNPLQAISNLHARAIELPSWIDPAYLRYTLIVHPKDSLLSDEEAGALFNAVKKQYGLHSYLLPLDMPNPPPAPVPVPTAKPRLPLSSSDSPEIPLKSLDHPSPNSSSTGVNTLRMSEKDIQQTAKFTREFLVMSLLPWMEKCVLDWNENFISTRRLPSRLFSSTRRLFGTPSPSPTPTPDHHRTTSRSSTYNGTPSSMNATGPPQQRRLAEFATILGDFKLAVTVWEALSKEGKGGSDILPLLLAPSPAIPLHVSNALASMYIQSAEPTAQVQLRALSCAIRWEIGIEPSDLVSEMLGGERWLVWAAGRAEEPPAALLLAHAALMSSKKQALRRAALWYLSAANRLEKCGIKPLTMYFLRKADDLYRTRPQKALSPSFWDAEGTSSSESQAFDAIMPGIEHPLGRLLYTTGHVKEAVRIFLGLLKGSTLSSPVSVLPAVSGNIDEESVKSVTDKVYLEDFRVAFEHMQANSSDLEQLNDFTLPFNFCVPRQTRLRFPNENYEGDPVEWERREQEWNKFCKTRGIKTRFATGSKASVNEPFWFDLALKNPLDIDVTLTNVTVAVRESNEDDPSSSKSFVEVEVVNNVSIGAGETRRVPISVKVARPASLTITHATYSFLSLLPATESLAVRGKRLHRTPAQLQTPTYAPDVFMQVNVVEAGCQLMAHLLDDRQLILNHGEVTPLRLQLSNTGVEPIGELWLVVGSNDLWVDDEEEQEQEAVSTDEVSSVDTVHSRNFLKPPEPFKISLGTSSAFAPAETLEISLTLHALDLGHREHHLLLLYRENEESPFKQVRNVQACEVRPVFRISTAVSPSSSVDQMFLLDAELHNVCSSAVSISQISIISPSWNCKPLTHRTIGTIYPMQSSRLVFGVDHWDQISGCRETLDYVSRKFDDVVRSKVIDSTEPPPLDLCCSHVIQTPQSQPLSPTAMHKFIHSGKRHAAAEFVASSYPYIPPHTHPHIFPLFNPAALDILICWAIPSEKRSGNVLISGLNCGATHSPLRDIVDAAENAKITRSMYAETQREKEEVVQAIRNSEWNLEMDPLQVTVRSASTVDHDFTKGPCRARINFTVRNYSTSLKSRFVLKLNDEASHTPWSSDVQPAIYSGRLTYRGILEPTRYVSFSARAWIGRSGTHALGNWRLETEVLEVSTDAADVEQVRHRYLQQPSLDDSPLLTVCGL